MEPSKRNCLVFACLACFTWTFTSAMVKKETELAQRPNLSPNPSSASLDNFSTRVATGRHQSGELKPSRREKRSSPSLKSVQELTIKLKDLITALKSSLQKATDLRGKNILDSVIIRLEMIKKKTFDELLKPHRNKAKVIDALKILIRELDDGRIRLNKEKSRDRELRIAANLLGDSYREFSKELKKIKEGYNEADTLGTSFINKLWSSVCGSIIPASQNRSKVLRNYLILINVGFLIVGSIFQGSTIYYHKKAVNLANMALRPFEGQPVHSATEPSYASKSSSNNLIGTSTLYIDPGLGWHDVQLIILFVAIFLVLVTVFYVVVLNRNKINIKTSRATRAHRRASKSSSTRTSKKSSSNQRQAI